jgi:hypothetical protein
LRCDAVDQAFHYTLQRDPEFVFERAPTCLRASRSERPPANRQGSVDNIDVHFVDIAIDPQKAIRKFDNLLVRLIIAYNA